MAEKEIILVSEKTVRSAILELEQGWTLIIPDDIVLWSTIRGYVMELSNSQRKFTSHRDREKGQYEITRL